jgi:hypothetical protein
MWTMAFPSEGSGRRVVALAVLILLAHARPARAQDTHYWSIQYGPVGQLVGGQLIGGVNDLSATYYNPGALVLRNESSYLLSTESFQWELVSTEAAPGLQVLDTSSSRFGAAPSLLAGVLPRWLGERTHLAWSVLTRQKLDLRLGQRVANPLSSPITRSTGESYFDQDASEWWGGLTASRALSDSLGVGLTWYGVYRGQRLRNELTFAGVGDGDQSLNALGVTDFEYNHYRMLAKLGLAWQGDTWKAGLAITTPSLSAFGGGKAARTVSLAGVDADQDGAPDPPTLQGGEAEDLDAYYKSSWAVGAGASRAFGPTRVYASAEWFAPVDRFTVIELPEGNANAGRLTQELGSVLNAGVGFERVMSPDVSIYGAFHTDFSASVGSARANVAISDWDIYHFSGGLSFRINDNSFTMGVSWAKGAKQRALDSTIPPESVPQAPLASEVDIHYSKLTFLLGFVFGR